MLVSPISFIIHSMIVRIAVFFLLVGGMAMVISFGSAAQTRQTIQIFCGGFFSVLIGVVILFRNRPKPAQSARFRSIRKYSNRKKG